MKIIIQDGSLMLITSALIAELRYELSAFRYQVDMLQLRLDRFEVQFGRKRTKTTGIMRARATG